MASKDKFVLITGASGYIGGQTVSTFLANGYRVRLACRDKSSCERTVSVFQGQAGNIDTVEVPDITAPHAFDEAVRNVGGVIHMASPFTYAIDDNEKDLILPAMNGTIRMLESVYEHAPQVKRVVITSSFAAIGDFSKGLRAGHEYDESQWNPMTYEEAKNAASGLAYAGSKKLAEEAAWKFLADNKVNFTLSTINPVMVYGPPYPNSISLKHLGQSTSEIYKLMNGSLAEVPITRMPVFVDVRDVALAHMKAYEASESGRFAMSSGHYTMDEICSLFRRELENGWERVPSKESNNPNFRADDHYSVNTLRARKILGIHFKEFRETFTDMAQAFLELEREQGKV